MSKIDEIYYAEKCCFAEPWTLAMLESEIENPLSVIETACRDGKTVSYALGRVVADEAELLKICVLGDYRRQGIAEKLLSELLTKMHEKGAAACYLEVRSRNLPAISLYKRLGFAEIGLRRNYYRDDDAVLMK
ncbi:MAG TPA: ribosomal-protein-alanine N-acetyltransferase, partial [Ruminococcaceae bacterium]|nr:ribosomal-protein-alanine N-acetyltransferase [Oscillospiraceae bacterium]